MRKDMRKGFSLVEMLVVIGIIAVLMGAGLSGYSSMTRRAQKAQGRELVSNTSTALNLLFQKTGRWPAALRNEAGSGAGRLRARPAACLAVNRLMALTYTTKDDNGAQVYTLSGLDKFGIVSPWAQRVLKRAGTSGGSEGMKVPSGGTVGDHVLYYALDLDGDGITEANVKGETLKVRANAAVWCAGADGVLDPYPYTSSNGKHNSDDIYSWAPNQVER